ncbi:MAG: glycosyltransferase family 2 protein [Muribaculaceae bacterium]|nr:glycosyltransferase family 2 protein [Muribaculaceae bacterium]
MNPSENLHKERMTIVVPVFNRPALIVRCLESLRSQTYRPLHVIVVDNDSTDDTLSVVEKWKKDMEVDDDFTMEIISESLPGAAYARQTGLQTVSTDKVMYFDSDDVMRPGCVSEVMSAWSVDPDADIVAWPVVIHHEGHPVVTHSIQGDILERHLVHALLRTQGYAVKTSFIRECGGWRGDFPVWNDFETGVRLLLNNPKIVAIREPLVDVYPQAESITGLSFSSKHGKWEKSLLGIDGSISRSGRHDSSRLHGIVNYRRAILAAHYAREGHEEFASPLYRQALQAVPKEKRPLIRFAYHWTRLGMRGAFSIIGRLL